MSEIVITKRGVASNGKNHLENFSKLSSYAYQGSILVQRQAQKDGITFTVIKNEKIYTVFPDGRKVLSSLNRLDQKSLFEPIITAK